MKSKYLLQAIGLSILLVLLIPTVNVSARASTNLPPTDMFQLPWEQGAAWVAIDGLDNGTNRPLNSSHNYLYGGAVDFAPHNGMRVGENTSNAWVTAAAAGTVIETSSCHLKINHGNGWVTEYQFIGNLQVKLGDSVYRNQRLAIVADGLRLKFCQPSINPDVPHLHFMLRPSIRNATFSGWTINYNSFFNSTTFTRNGQTLGLYKPLLNVPSPSLEIVLRGPIAWDTVYTGSVDTLRYEKWSFTLPEQTFFTMGAIPTTAGLTPLLLLLDANGNEVIRTTDIFSTTLPAGNYFVQIQPQVGTGSYQLLAQKDGYGSPIPDGPSVSTVVGPSSINVGESTIVTLKLNNIPVEGYTSAEFTCTYDASVATASNIADAGLFGADAAMAISGPQNGSFIVAVAGSNGNKATGSGAAITFNLTGLRAGWTLVTCTARVSKGDNTLVAIPVTPASLAVLPVDSLPPTAAPTPGQDPAATATPTSISSASPTATALPTGAGMLTGQVLASKPVGVNLYNTDHTLAASAAANTDGTFSLTAPAGTYTVVATAAGFLSVQGSVTLSAGATGTMPMVSLLAGDIDNNNVIDQFDAMTIAMNYNTAVPAAADLNSDGIINLLDLELLARNYRKTGPLAWR